MDDEQPTAVGRAKGGIARREKLTPERRSEIARKAAQARHAGTAIPLATHIGEIQLGELILPCAVLPDGSRLISQGGISAAFGPTTGGWQMRKKSAEEHSGDLPPFLVATSLQPFISADVRTLVSSSRMYKDPRGGPVRIGLDAALIPKICDVWLKARDAGALTRIQLPVALRAEVLMRALAHLGIVALVDEATGFQEVRTKDALQQYLELLVRKDLAVWAKKFPDEFYENIYKLRGWPWAGMSKNRYSAVAGYTRDLVYERMAPGLLDDLRSKSPQDEDGHRPNKLHQWLTDDVGHPMLASHLQSILTLQRLAIANGWGWLKFMGMVDQIMKKKGDTLDLPFEST